MCMLFICVSFLGGRGRVDMQIDITITTFHSFTTSVSYSHRAGLGTKSENFLSGQESELPSSSD